MGGSLGGAVAIPSLPPLLTRPFAFQLPQMELFHPKLSFSTPNGALLPWGVNKWRVMSKRDPPSPSCSSPQSGGPCPWLEPPAVGCAGIRGVHHPSAPRSTTAIPPYPQCQRPPLSPVPACPPSPVPASPLLSPQLQPPIRPPLTSHSPSLRGRWVQSCAPQASRPASRIRPGQRQRAASMAGAAAPPQNRPPAPKTAREPFSGHPASRTSPGHRWALPTRDGDGGATGTRNGGNGSGARPASLSTNGKQMCDRR